MLWKEGPRQLFKQTASLCTLLIWLIRECCTTHHYTEKPTRYETKSYRDVQEEGDVCIEMELESCEMSEHVRIVQMKQIFLRGLYTRSVKIKCYGVCVFVCGCVYSK